MEWRRRVGKQSRRDGQDWWHRSTTRRLALGGRRPTIQYSSSSRTAAAAAAPSISWPHTHTHTRVVEHRNHPSRLLPRTVDLNKSPNTATVPILGSQQSNEPRLISIVRIESDADHRSTADRPLDCATMQCCILRRPSADLLKCLSILTSICNLLVVRLLVTAAIVMLILRRFCY